MSNNIQLPPDVKTAVVLPNPCWVFITAALDKMPYAEIRQNQMVGLVEEINRQVVDHNQKVFEQMKKEEDEKKDGDEKKGAANDGKEGDGKSDADSKSSKGDGQKKGKDEADKKDKAK